MLWVAYQNTNTICSLYFDYSHRYKKCTFCWQEEPSSVHSRHLESNTNTVVGSLNVTLSLDTVNIHVMLVHVICMSSIENGMSHWTSDNDTSRAAVKNTSPVPCISCKYDQRRTVEFLPISLINFHVADTWEKRILHLFVRVPNENGMYTKNTKLCTASDKM